MTNRQIYQAPPDFVPDTEVQDQGGVMAVWNTGKLPRSGSVAMNSDNSVSEGLSGMSKTGSPRQPMGTSLVGEFHVASVQGGKLVPRKSSKGGTTAGFGTYAPGRGKHVMQSSLGARYTISVSLSGPRLPEARNTQASGRIVAPACNRSRVGFDDEARHFGVMGPSR